MAPSGSWPLHARLRSGRPRRSHRDVGTSVPARVARRSVAEGRRRWRCRPARPTLRPAAARPRRPRRSRRRRRRWAGRAAPRARRRRPAPRPGGSPGPTARRRRRPAGSRRVSGSMAMPSTVLTSVTASAPAVGGRGGDRRRGRSTLGLSLAHRGRPHGRRWPPSPRAVASVEWANMSPPRLEVGARQVHLDRHHLGRARRPAASAAARVLVDRAAPDAAPPPAAPVASSAGSSSASHAATPGPCRPDAVEHPGRASRAPAARGCPATGSADSDFTTTAPSAARSK